LITQIPDRQPLIQLNAVDKIYQTPAGSFTALKGVSVDFYHGEFVSVQGKSGSGKSTLMNMITGIDHPTAGTVRVGDEFVHKMKESQMAIWRGRNLGIVFQFFQLLPTLTVLENVLIPMDLGNCYSPDQREGIALQLLDRLGLVDEADKMPAELSGGQQQIAAIARALANDPPILIADEPTGNLDSRAADKVFQIFDEMAGQGRMILMVTHDQTIAKRTQRQLIISDGELINEVISNAFQEINHSDLLILNRATKKFKLIPGEVFRPIDYGMIIIESGRVEMVLEQNGQRTKLPFLEPGGIIPITENYSTELLATDQAEASLLLIDENTIKDWVNRSELARSLLEDKKSNLLSLIAGARNSDALYQPGSEKRS